MNFEITDKNLYLLLPGKVVAVSAIYAEEHRCSIKESMRMFYASDVYKKLQQEETKLWHLGAVALYEIWQS